MRNFEGMKEQTEVDYYVYGECEMKLFGDGNKGNKEILDKAIEYLENNPVIEYDRTEICPDILMDALGILKTDVNYVTHCAAMEGKEPENMNKKEISALLTQILRGERFSDGYIVSCANDGTLLRVFKRLREIL